MERFLEDSELIKVLRGSRIEMNQAIIWILQHSGWRDAIGTQIRRF